MGRRSSALLVRPSLPRARAIVVVPITFNSVGKAANGIADTLAHSAMAEALGEGLPFVAVSMVNQYLAGNPAWAQNTKHLTAAGVTWVSVVDGTVGRAPACPVGHRVRARRGVRSRLGLEAAAASVPD